MGYQIVVSDELLPVCAACKKICDHAGNWHVVDDFIRNSLEANFTHTICPECARRLYPNIYAEMYDDEDLDNPCSGIRSHRYCFYN